MVEKPFSPHDPNNKVNGTTAFIEDIAFPNQLVGGIKRSPHPHAKIISIDTSKAKEVQGVVTVLTADDLPTYPFGPTKFKDWNFLASDRVLFIGDEVAAVSGETKECVQQALELITIEYEILPAVYHPQEALSSTTILHQSANNNRPMHLQIERGDFENAKKQADVVRKGTYVINPIYQGHLEPIAAIAKWSKNDGMTLWAGSHIPYRARETYAAAFGLDEDQFRIIVPPIGGSFGSKYVLKMHLLVSALSKASSRPVKIVFDRKEDMITAHPRVPLNMEVEIGSTNEGTFVYKDVVVYADAGARIYWSPNIVATACTRPDGVYHFGSVRAEGHLCYTNNSPTTCMRGFGNAEMLFGVESVIDDLAEALAMDPTELRKRNIVKKGQTTIHGYQLDSCQLEQCIEKVKELSGWARRGHLPENHGIGIALGNHVSGFSAIDPRFDGSTAIVTLKPNGNITVQTGEIDLGQGLSQTYANIAASVLGIPSEMIEIQSGDTALHPFGVGTLASRGTVMGGNAVQFAAEEMKQQILKLVHEEWNGIGVFEAGEILIDGKRLSFADVADLYRTKRPGEVMVIKKTYTPNTELPDKTYYGHPSPNYPFAAHVAEVKVDTETGRVQVVGYWAVHDSGKILNFTGAKSQVIGAVAQGIGWVLMEELIVRNGQVLNPSLMDYRMPGAGDMPQIDVAFIEEPDPHGPQGAKSVGEIALDPVPGAIANAIANAIKKRGYSLPLNPQAIWGLIREQDDTNRRELS